MIRLGGYGRDDGGRGRVARRTARAWRLATLLAIAAAAIWASGALASGGSPEAETERAENVGRTSALLVGTVDPHGSLVTECAFRYGTTPALGSSIPCSYSPGAGVTPVPVEASLGGLSESTTYYVELFAKNANGESLGGQQHFTTLPAAPKVDTAGGKTVGHTTATLEGFVNPNESEVTECFFEYGTAPNALTSTAACATLPGAGTTPVPVSAEIAGLSETTGYYYRLVAANAHGTTLGDREKLLTLPNRPKTNTEPATEVGHTTATLRAFVNPRDSLVEDCHFNWGETPALGNSAPCEPSPGAGEESVAVTAHLSGLHVSTSYYYEVVATNSFGESEAGTNKLTTLPTVAHAEVRAPEEVSARSAVLRGVVNPEGTTLTQCFFEYGTTPAFGFSVPCGELPSGETFAKVKARLTGLAPGTSYVYRLVVSNGFGTDYSGEQKFSSFPAGIIPVISKLSPKKGSSAGGTAVTIRGTNLAEIVAVHFGEAEAQSISADTTTSVTAVAPPGAGAVDVRVTTLNGTSEISGSDRYTYGAPMITSVTPHEGPIAGGTAVTVEGSGFTPGAGATSFIFGKGAMATGVECSSSAVCTMTTPAQTRAGTVKVTAVAGGKKSKSSPGGTFVYTP